MEESAYLEEKSTNSNMDLNQDLRIRFFSFAGGEFDGAVNNELCNFSKPDVLHGHPVFREAYSREEFPQDFRNWLNSGDVIVLLGDPGELDTGVSRELVVRNLCIVSSDSKSGSPYIDKHANKSDVAFLGIQQHLSTLSSSSLKFGKISTLRLGTLRESMKEVEPLIREREVGVFSLSSIRKSDAKGKLDDGISGLFSEEACRLSRYLGLADASKVLWIKGFQPSGAYTKETANLVAQLVWYFLDGVQSRKDDYPLLRDKLVEIAISGPSEADAVLFYRSKNSGRWWFSLNKEFNPLELIPCSHLDYQLMCEGEISKRIWEALAIYNKNKD